jgi:hypothetical protein
MADEAFALSPIAARAAQPSEADYDAIMEAFMETSRGRWFLGEYAKRNRNADTRLVLDAVARIEETLAAQKKPSRDPLLDEALAAFRSALAEIKGATEAALGDLALEEHLAPVNKSVRVIREITWRLREIGADGRICDLVDSQISAIEEATAKVATTDLPTALCEAFELVETRIAAFDAGEAKKISTTPPTEAAPPEALAQAQDEALDEAALPAAETMVEHATAAALPAEERAEVTVETTGTATEMEAASGEQAMAVETVAEVAEHTEGEPADAFDAEDEAMLDRVAFEMAAPDTDVAYEPVDEIADGATAGDEMAEPHAPPAKVSRVETPPPAEPLAATANAHVPVDDIEITFVSEAGEQPAEPVPETPLMETPLMEEPVATAPVQAQVTQTQVVAEAQVTPEVEPEPSLGSSLIANGIVQRPRTSKPDPLAPIRRMSQSERIAFFS